MEHANTTSGALQNRSFNWNDFLSFRTMVTLRIIQVLYIIVAILITIASLVIMFRGNGNDYGYRSAMPGGFFMGLLLLVFGNITWRIWCELMIVIFRINKSLNNIDNNTARQPFTP